MQIAVPTDNEITRFPPISLRAGHLRIGLDIVFRYLYTLRRMKWTWKRYWLASAERAHRGDPEAGENMFLRNELPSLTVDLAITCDSPGLEIVTSNLISFLTQSILPVFLSSRKLLDEETC